MISLSLNDLNNGINDWQLERRILEEYQRRKERDEHPSGWFDTKGRWYPYCLEDLEDMNIVESEIEKASCCSMIREPSRKWPYSLMNHCRTKKHIRNRIIENIIREMLTVLKVHENEVDLVRSFDNQILYLRVENIELDSSLVQYIEKHHVYSNLEEIIKELEGVTDLGNIHPGLGDGFEQVS